jgi:hypothetical protein
MKRYWVLFKGVRSGKRYRRWYQNERQRAIGILLLLDRAQAIEQGYKAPTGRTGRKK